MTALPSSYISDAQRVEIALPIVAMRDLVKCGVEENDADKLRAMELLGAAYREAFDGMTVDRSMKLQRRAAAAFGSVTDEYREEGIPVAKSGLIWFYVLSRLINQGYMVLHPGTAMSDAMDLILPALSEHTAEAAFDRAAQKQARRVLTKLKWRGYYAGVRIDEGVSEHE